MSIKGENSTTIEEACRAAVNELEQQNTLDVVQVYTKGSVFTIIATNKFFEFFTLVIIMFNAVWIGIDINHNPAESLINAETPFVLVENFFCFYFSYEVLIRFLAFRYKSSCLKDGWFMFDSLLVSFMIFETWVFPLLISGNSNALGSLSLLRLFRLLRLTRMARIMRSVPELLTLIKGIGAASRSVASTLALLIIILYVFGIIFTGQFSPELEKDDCEDCIALWGTVSDSMFTLFVAGTLLDDITVVCDKIRDSPAWHMLILFYFYVLLSSFTILNMLIGVVCEVISSTAATERESAMVSHVNQLLTTVFQEIDLDGSGLISKKEFDLMTEKEEVIVALTMLDVQPKHLMALSDTLFEPDGDDLEDKELSFQEFLQMIILLRPQNNASVLDVAQLRKCQRRLTISVESKLLALEDALDPSGEKRRLFSEARRNAITKQTTRRIDKMARRITSRSGATQLFRGASMPVRRSSSRELQEAPLVPKENSRVNDLRILLDRQRERCNRANAQLIGIESKIEELHAERVT